MKRHRIDLLLPILAVCTLTIGLLGCGGDGDDGGSSETGLPGTWELNRATITAPMVGDNAILLQLAGVDVDDNTLTADSSFLSLFGVSAILIVDNDGTWALQVTVPSIPGYVDAGSYTAEGTYSTSGDRLTFTATSVPSQAAGLFEVGDTYTISYGQSGNSLSLSASSADLSRPGVAGTLNFTRQ